MTEEKAIQVSSAIEGSKVWQSGGNIWVVEIYRSDGHYIVIGDSGITEYANEKTCYDGEDPISNINFFSD